MGQALSALSNGETSSLPEIPKPLEIPPPPTQASLCDQTRSYRNIFNKMSPGALDFYMQMFAGRVTFSRDLACQLADVSPVKAAAVLAYMQVHQPLDKMHVVHLLRIFWDRDRLNQTLALSRAHVSLPVNLTREMGQMPSAHFLIGAYLSTSAQSQFDLSRSNAIVVYGNHRYLLRVSALMCATDGSTCQIFFQEVKPAIVPRPTPDLTELCIPELTKVLITWPWMAFEK